MKLRARKRTAAVRGTMHRSTYTLQEFRDDDSSAANDSTFAVFDETALMRTLIAEEAISGEDALCEAAARRGISGADLKALLSGAVVRIKSPAPRST